MENKQPTFGNGKICYLEIPARDPRVSMLFYKEVFGWRIREREDGSLAFDDGVGEVSGTWVTSRKPLSDPGIIISIMVDDARATVDSIIAHGGKIERPLGKDAPEITALFSDPAGNVLGIYQHPVE